MLRAFVGVILAVVLGFLCLAQAEAQSEADKTTARNLFFEARSAFDAGRYDEAADLFRRSNELYPAPTAALGLARALREGGKLVAAHETYAAIVTAGVPDGGSQVFSEAVEMAAAERSALEPRLAAVVITVEGPPGAAVHIDGVEIPIAAIGVKRFVDPGERRIDVFAEGYRAASRTVHLSEGQVEAIELELELEPLPAVRQEAGPPPRSAPLSEPRAGPEKSAMRPLGLAIGGIGLASLTVAAVTGGLYLKDKATVDERCPKTEGGRFCADQDGLEAASRGKTLGLVNTVTLPVGVAAVGVGVILFLLAPEAEEVAMTPIFDGTMRGAVLRGRF